MNRDTIEAVKGTNKKFSFVFAFADDLTDPSDNWKIFFTVKSSYGSIERLIDIEGILNKSEKSAIFEIPFEKNSIPVNSYYYDINIESEPLNKRFPLKKGIYKIGETVRYT